LLDHEPATVADIEREASKAVSAAQKEFEKDIYMGIQAKETAAGDRV
jgi:hypothetical protein